MGSCAFLKVSVLPEFFNVISASLQPQKYCPMTFSVEDLRSNPSLLLHLSFATTQSFCCICRQAIVSGDAYVSTQRGYYAHSNCSWDTAGSIVELHPIGLPTARPLTPPTPPAT